MASRTLMVCCTLALLVSGSSARASLGLLGQAVGEAGAAAGGILGGLAQTAGGIAETAGGVAEAAASTAAGLLELPKVLVLTGVDFLHGVSKVIPELKTPLHDVLYPQGTLSVDLINSRLNQCVSILQQLVAQNKISHTQAQDLLVRIQEQLRPVLAGKLDPGLVARLHL